MALALPEAAEGSHFANADFRVGGKIFATLRPDGAAVVKLTAEQQEIMAGAEPAIFSPVPGAWGKKGWTRINLANADETALASALTAAWRNVAPKRLL